MNHLPTASVNIFLVGIHGVGKKSIAASLMAGKSSFPKAIHTCISLPLTHGYENTKIDYIILMLSMSSKQSFLNIKSSLEHIDYRLLQGRTIIIATRGEHLKSYAFPLTDLQELAIFYNVVIHHVDIKSEQSINTLCSSILNNACLCNGSVKGVTPLFLNTLDVCFVPTTSTIESTEI